MERPKSAKYNIERVKKSSSYLNGQAKPNAQSVNDELLESDLNVSRYNQSKSAYISRPQSARHNLDKYRQDVKNERIEPPPPAHSQHLIDTSRNNNEIVDLLMNQDDLDKMDALLIREDEDSSSSDLESLHSLSNNKISTQKVSLKPVKKPSKLLSKRNTGVVVASVKEPLANNKSVLLNQYHTTFRPTAVTTNYSSSSPLANQRVITLHPVTTNTTSSNDTLNNGSDQTIIASGGGSSGESSVMGMNTEEAIILSGEITTASANGQPSSSSSQQMVINSSSSSTSTSSSSKKHLAVAGDSAADTMLSTTSQKKRMPDSSKDQLLKEWLKNDDEVELEIMTISSNNGKSQQQQQQPQRPMGNKKAFTNSNYPQKSVQQQQNNRNYANGRSASRFSDYSNVSANTGNSEYQQQQQGGGRQTMGSYNQNNARNDRTNLIDPWTKRNPTVVAQNVLMKHRAELEQLAASRNANNYSQISNASTTTTGPVYFGKTGSGGSGSGGPHHHHQPTSKYLIPENNKYYKK